MTGFVFFFLVLFVCLFVCFCLCFFIVFWLSCFSFLFYCFYLCSGVGGIMSFLRCLCLFVYSGVQHILCCVYRCFSTSCVPCVASFSGFSICYCPSVFSNVCFSFENTGIQWYLTSTRTIKLYLWSVEHGSVSQSFFSSQFVVFCSLMQIIQWCHVTIMVLVSAPTETFFSAIIGIMNISLTFIPVFFITSLKSKRLY